MRSYLKDACYPCPVNPSVFTHSLDGTFTFTAFHLIQHSFLIVQIIVNSILAKWTHIREFGYNSLKRFLTYASDEFLERLVLLSFVLVKF